MNLNPTASSAEPSIHSINSNAMKRQRIPPQPQHNSDYISGGNADVMSFDPRRSPHDGGAADETPDSSCDVALNDIPLYRTHSSRQAAGAPSQRPRNVLEAQVQDGDTLQAIAIRYRCSVADIKRLNKIERDYEIHAHKTLQVPLTAENVLADHLLSADTTQSAVGAAAKTPADSLRDVLNAQAEQHQASTSTSTTAMPPLTATTTNFAAGGSRGPSINEIILNTKIQPNQYMDATEAVNASLTFDEENTLAEQSLLDNDGDDAFVRQPRPIRAGASVIGMDLSCSGSDCDISWTVLLVCILALCFAIPLIYVLYIAEHTHSGGAADDGGGVVHHAEDHHASPASSVQSDQHWDA